MTRDGRLLGSLIATAGGAVFVQVGASTLPVEAAVRVAGVLAVVVVLGAVVRYGRSGAVPPPRPSPRGRRVYAASVAAMVVAIPLGAAVLRALDRADLVPVWVVLVVGTHFAPFGRVFGQPLFTTLSATLVAMALVGGVATVAGAEDAPAWTTVGAGFALLGSALAGVLRPQPRR